MNKIFKTAIIGGGASGLLCAIELLRSDDALSSEDIVIIEKNERFCKKLSATGNGQGNILNKNFSCEFYHGEKNFINIFINCAKEIDLEKYLYDLGIPVIFDEEGRGYPLSKQATSVTDALRFYLESKCVLSEFNFKVDNVIFKDGLFEISSSSKTIMAENVILCCGGKASKQFGTDGELYKIAKAFGHYITPLYPSLVQLKTDISKMKGLKNLKETARITAIINGKKVAEKSGDLLFTDYGVSGSAVFKISPYVSGEKDAKLNIEFLPSLTLEETEKIIKDKIKNYQNKDDLEILTGIINKKIGQAILKTCINKKPEVIAKALKNFELNVLGTMGFDYAQVTKGGVDTEKINPYTLESKLRRNLYLCGEILNIDGDCGGYNLMFAFATGILAARNIKEKYKK